MLAHRSAVSVGTKPIVQNVLRAIRSRVRTLPSRESIRIISDSLPQVARSGSTHSDKFFRLAHIFLPSFLSITGAAVSVYICKGMWETACKAAKHIVALVSCSYPTDYFDIIENNNSTHIWLLT